VLKIKNMGRNVRLNSANKKKHDEYYTLYEDIAREVPLYKNQLTGKRIICPCDWDEGYFEDVVFKREIKVETSDLFLGGMVREVDIAQSYGRIEKDINLVKCNFVKFLISHADDYGIQSISVSGYNPATQEGVKFQDIDFSKYDLVITNPPFSSFIEFINTMFRNKLQFLVIGPQTAIGYKDIFPHIMNNEMWMGYHYHLTGFMKEDGTILPKNHNLPRSCCWFTNLDVSYRHNKMILTENYDPNSYPVYYNYEAIDVKKTISIPFDFDGLMGVPITFLQKYNPDQFEILGMSGRVAGKMPDNIPKKLKGGPAFYLQNSDGSFKRLFGKLVIRNKQVNKD
jgi:hypothetical protein